MGYLETKNSYNVEIDNMNLYTLKSLMYNGLHCVNHLIYVNSLELLGSSISQFILTFKGMCR